MPKSSAMEKLLAGVRKFQTEIYPQHRDRYQRAAREPQKPHTLIVTCSDSRIDPELITQSGPGEIFVTRNIGNLVPAYGEMLGGVSAVVEYAVQALGVQQVVICGHTDCGAMKALLHRETLTDLPTVNLWLRNAEAALSIIKARNTAFDEHAALDQLIGENVVLQMNHLRTHPSVAGKIAQGALTIHGWIYDIAHGEVRIYNPETHDFSSVTSGSAVAS
jgi:carbonic anhydrase